MRQADQWWREEVSVEIGMDAKSAFFKVRSAVDAAEVLPRFLRGDVPFPFAAASTTPKTVGDIVRLLTEHDMDKPLAVLVTIINENFDAASEGRDTETDYVLNITGVDSTRDVDHVNLFAEPIGKRLFHKES